MSDSPTASTPISQSQESGHAPVIDSHGHFVPAGLFDAVRSAQGNLPSIDIVEVGEGQQALAMPGLSAIRPMPKVLDSIAESTAWLNKHDIDGQVVGTWADLFGYDLDPNEAGYWCRLVNELQLSELEGRSAFLPLAILPLQNTDLALAEIEHAHSSGYNAVTIGCRAGDRELDDPDLEAVWAELATRQMPVVMHPSFHAGEARTSDLGLPNTVGRPHDTDVAVARLVLSGTLARNPGSKLLLMHGGGSIPLLWGRLERNHAISTGTTDPEKSRDSIWVDSVVYRPESLEFLTAAIGEDRVVLGSDYPFPIQDPNPRQIVERSGLDAPVKQKISGSNAAALFSWSLT